MSNFGGPASAFEKDFAVRFRSLSRRLTKLEMSLQRLSISAINGARASMAYWRAIEIEMDVIYGQMIGQFNDWAAKEIPIRYRNSLFTINQRITRNKGIVAIGKKTTTQLLNSTASNQIVNALYQDAAASFSSAAAVGKRNLVRYTRATQQALIGEGLVDITVATGFELGNLRIAADGLTAGFWSAMDEGIKNKKFVQAGKFKYRPEYYAELVARTKFHAAHTQASLMQGRNLGTDLMQVSSHNTETRLCMPFEGKIYSASGKDFRFPPLTDSPPYHPNCLHLIMPAFETAMEVQGTLQGFSDFSQGKINKPPVPSGFVPINQRGKSSLLRRAAGPTPKDLKGAALLPTSKSMPNLTAKRTAASGLERKGLDSSLKGFEKSPAVLQSAVEKHTDFKLDFLKPGTNGASYNAERLRVTIGDKLKSVNRSASLRHEIGHHLDNKMGPRIGSRGFAFSNTGDYKTALQNDVRNILGNAKQNTSLNKILNGSKVGDSSLSDLFDAATQGRVKGYFTHGRGYYSGNPERIYGEPFANMTEIYGRSGRGAWTFLQKNLPESTKIYEQAIIGL